MTTLFFRRTEIFSLYSTINLPSYCLPIC